MFFSSDYTAGEYAVVHLEADILASFVSWSRYPGERQEKEAI